jgi:hypothetical protein
MQPVESSAVAMIGYDDEAAEAYVQFHDSGTYVYSGVPPVVFESLRHAASKGKFANEVLKPLYSCRRL